MLPKKGGGQTLSEFPFSYANLKKKMFAARIRGWGSPPSPWCYVPVKKVHLILLKEIMKKQK